MKYWVDLHIHSCLSPCAEEDMTPNNIVNMALIKGLDIIAVTDHNSVKNAAAIMEVGQEAGLLVVPGMELCTSEEIHLVCLFSSINKALDFEKLVYRNHNQIRNREDIFGTQIIMDKLDKETGREEMMLSGACIMDMETAINSVRKLGGAIIPAHVNRESFSILNTLGAIPSEYGFKYLEYSKTCVLDDFIKMHPELRGYKHIQSSDAHFLCEILEQNYFLELPEKSIDALLEHLCK